MDDVLMDLIWNEHMAQGLENRWMVSSTKEVVDSV